MFVLGFITGWISNSATRYTRAILSDLQVIYWLVRPKS